MKFPLIKKNEDAFPKNSICPICKKCKVYEPHSFVFIGGGALSLDEEGDSKKSNDMIGYFDFSWHGHHYKNVHDNKKDNYFTMRIVEDSKQGQFGFYFCSTKCLRRFFNYLVDDFEKELTKIAKIA